MVLVQPKWSEEVSKKNSAAIEIKRLVGKKGGEAPAAKLAAEQRTEIARRAVIKRAAQKITVDMSLFRTSFEVEKSDIHAEYENLPIYS